MDQLTGSALLQVIELCRRGFASGNPTYYTRIEEILAEVPTTEAIEQLRGMAAGGPTLVSNTFAFPHIESAAHRLIMQSGEMGEPFDVVLRDIVTLCDKGERHDTLKYYPYIMHRLSNVRLIDPLRLIVATAFAGSKFTDPMFGYRHIREIANQELEKLRGLSAVELSGLEIQESFQDYKR